MNDALRKPSLIRYGFFALPLAFAGLPLYMHMPDLYAREFGLNLAVLGTVLLVIRLIDAVQDPVLGYMSDQYAHHRTTIMYIGTATLALGLAGLCFGPPATTVTVLWFSGCMVLATTGYSVLTINLNFIGGFWKRDENHRITIASWREAFGLIGLLIAAIVPAVAQTRLTVMQSYMALFIVFGVLMGVGIVLIRNFLATTELETEVGTNQERASFAFLSILTGKDRLFFAICFVSYIAASIPAILVLPFVRDYLDAEAMTGLFLALYFFVGRGVYGVLVKNFSSAWPTKNVACRAFGCDPDLCRGSRIGHGRYHRVCHSLRGLWHGTGRRFVVSTRSFGGAYSQTKSRSDRHTILCSLGIFAQSRIGHRRRRNIYHAGPRWIHGRRIEYGITEDCAFNPLCGGTLCPENRIGGAFVAQNEQERI